MIRISIISLTVICITVSCTPITLQNNSDIMDDNLIVLGQYLENIRGWDLYSNLNHKSLDTENDNYIATRQEKDLIGQKYNIHISGDFATLKSLVSDPFFGISQNEALTSEQENFLEEKKYEENIKNIHYKLVVEKLAIQQDTMQSRGNVYLDAGVNAKAGDDFTFNLGVVFNGLNVLETFTELPSNNNASVDGGLNTKELWSSKWKAVASNLNMTGANLSYQLSGFRFGWWSWQTTLHFDTDAVIMVRVFN